MSSIPYDEDYFERGVETGKSGYRNYRWLPELTIPMAMSYIDYLAIDRDCKILDFGCAKGYVVKALRLLYRQAWGCDISEYAINSSDNTTRQYLELCTEETGLVPFDIDFDVILAKDVFEHVPEDRIDSVLSGLAAKGKQLFCIIPLGRDDKYVIPAYSLDVTHCLAKEHTWWIERLNVNNWQVTDFSFYIPGIKESWANYRYGNGFFLAQSL